MLAKFFYNPYFNQKCWVDSFAAHTYSCRICLLELFFIFYFKFPFKMTLFLSNYPTEEPFEYSFQKPPQQRTVQSQIIYYHSYNHSKQAKMNKQNMDRCCVNFQ